MDGRANRPRELSRLVFSGITGTRLEPGNRAFLERLRPGGLVLFTPNVASLEELAAFIAEIKTLDPEILVSVDQEGGPVDRLRPHLPSLPSGLALGVAGDPILARRHGELTGEMLAMLGFDWDLAPVCDLALSHADNAIGLRSFGPDPERVIPLARAVLEGLESQGVLGCLKHFPGLGQAPADSHLTLPVIPTPRLELIGADISVFDALRPLAMAVMVGHGYYPHLTLKGAFPASISAEITTSLLKQELGFSGAAVTDDLVMGALATEEIGNAAVRALEAGSDILLVCQGEDKALRVAEAVSEAAASGRLTAGRLDDAFARVARLRARLLHLRRRAAVPMLPRPEPARLELLRRTMAELAREVAERSVTAIRRVSGKDPMVGPVLVLRPRLKWLSQECARPEGSPFAHTLAAAGLESREIPYDSEQALADSAALLHQEPPPGAWLVATADAQRKPPVVDMIRALAARAPVHHLALGWPRDLEEGPVRASVATYGCGWESVAEGVRVLLGVSRARGKLMV